MLLGFSQGACLSLEFAARHAGPYAAVVGLSGGLIGPPGTPRDYAGTFESTPVFLGCSDIDAHIPLARVRESADVFRRMGAAVDVIVIGTHGRGGMAHLLMGSVAEIVVRMAPCPVLTVRHPEHEFVLPDEPAKS